MESLSRTSCTLESWLRPSRLSPTSVTHFILDDKGQEWPHRQLIRVILDHNDLCSASFSCILALYLFFSCILALYCATQLFLFFSCILALYCATPLFFSSLCMLEVLADWQTSDRQADRQARSQTSRQTYWQTDRQADRQAVSSTPSPKNVHPRAHELRASDTGTKTTAQLSLFTSHSSYKM